MSIGSAGRRSTSWLARPGTCAERGATGTAACGGGGGGGAAAEEEEGTVMAGKADFCPEPEPEDIGGAEEEDEEFL